MKAQLCVAEAEETLKEFQDQQVAWMMEVAQIRWIQESGTCASHIFSSFKQHAIQKDISKLMNDVGEVKTAWEDLANIARQHFIKLVGTPSQVLVATLEEVLNK